MQTIIASGDGPLSFLSQFGVEWQLLFSQAISFAIVAAALYHFAFKPVILKARKRRAVIERGLKDAENARKRLDDAEQEARAKLAQTANESSAILRKAREEAKLAAEAAAAAAATKAAEIIERAEKLGAAERERIKDELRTELSALVVKAAEAAVAEVLTPEQRGKLAEIAAQKLTENR